MGLASPPLSLQLVTTGVSFLPSPSPLCLVGVLGSPVLTYIAIIYCFGTVYFALYIVIIIAISVHVYKWAGLAFIKVNN